MSYVKTTGTNIGNCLTGFGIHYPITIYNSGNAAVLYSVENSNSNNFSLSKNDFTINAGDYDIFDVFYRPTLSNSLGDEITDLTISSISTDDGSVDPSGDITLNLTGSKLINITGGNPRAFRVIGDTSSVKYNFYWKDPTGISGSNLKNYFITGYRLDLATGVGFTNLQIKYSKDFNIAENTDLNPKFSTYYGFSDDDTVFELNQNIYSDLTTNQDYYARLYSLTNNNSGVSIYTTGVNSNADDYSDEVSIGYSGTPINIKLVKKAFNFYINFSTWYSYTYDLYAALINENNFSSDFSAYSGINIYLPEKSVFESRDGSVGALKLDGLFNNLTGDGGTFINIYVPYDTELRGKYGDGTNVYYERGMEKTGTTYGSNFLPKDPAVLLNLSVTNNGTNPTDPLKKYSDTTNGGPCITLKAQTNLGSSIGVRTDIKYNIYSELPNINKALDLGNGVICKPKFGAGAGGGKGGFAYVNIWQTYFLFFDTSDINSPTQYGVIPFNGSYPKGYLEDTAVNRKYWFYYVFYNAASFSGILDTNGNPARILEPTYDVISPILNNGEVGSAYLSYQVKGEKNSYYFPYLATNNSNLQLSYKNLVKDALFWYPFNKDLNNRQPGYLIDSFSNASVNYGLYNKNLASDYVFRFDQSGISNATSPLAKSWSGSGSYTLENLTSANEGAYISNYKSLGSSTYKAINLKNNQFLKLTFTTNTSFDNFDLFFVCSFDDFTFTDNNVYCSVFDWYSNQTNITSNQFTVKNFESLSNRPFPKENISFNYNNTCLTNVINNSTPTDYGTKISKQLYIRSKVSSIISNVITTSTKHNLQNGDIIYFYADTLPSGIASYDSSSPHAEDKNTYIVSNVTDYTFKLGALTISGGSNVYVEKIKSNALYRPFILQIRRIGSVYAYFINRELVDQTALTGTLLKDLKNTTLKLINRNSSIGINYFDITFYNRLLSESELNSAYAYYADYYMSLFTGEANCTSINLKSDLYSFRLPNIFNLAGKS
jgi:hypothetical protein